MFMLYFVNAMQSTVLGSLTAFVTSEFEAHSLLTVITIVSNSMTAALYIPVAKILDLWGRAEGFLIMTVFATLGLILMATSNGLATFCAAQVFYSIGFGGMTYCIDVITADVSKLKNRGLAYAFTSSPYVITAFAGPKAAEDFYEKVNWRWGFGCFAIILPFVAAPLYLLLKANLRKAEKAGIVISEKSGRTIIQSIIFYVIEFDGKQRSCRITTSTDFLSLRLLPLRRRSHRVPAPLHPRRLRSQQLGHGLYYRHDRRWLLRACLLCPL